MNEDDSDSEAILAVSLEESEDSGTQDSQQLIDLSLKFAPKNIPQMSLNLM